MKKLAASIALVLGFSIALSPLASGATASLTSAQKAQLVYLVEEEKLARDVYTYLLTNAGSQKFRNIARSEQTHMDLVSGILKTYGVNDPTIGEKVGVFKNTELAGLYKKLIASGSVNYAGALAAGVTIEKLDIADLKTDVKSETAPDILWVLNTLLRGSENHLQAFSR